MSSHSPTLASVAPLRSVVYLRTDGNSTTAYSLANLRVDEDEYDDLERYLTATRSELLFARGVIFVEGDAEEALMSVFANAIGYDLDELGITVCNVAGTHFVPYVKLALGLGIPYSVVTDWDPLDGSKEPLGVKRTRSISTLVNPRDLPNSSDTGNFNSFNSWAEQRGVFLNELTFEVAIANTDGLQQVLFKILSQQQFGSVRMKRIDSWKAGGAVDPIHLLTMISDIGKGRLSAKLARTCCGLTPPAYIAKAIKYVVERVQ